MLRTIAALLAATTVLALGFAACSPQAECLDFGLQCRCSDGTTQLGGCDNTCPDLCATRGGWCPGYFDECNCACGLVTDVPFSNCAVLPSTCEAACEHLGGVADAGTFDGSCPDECAMQTLSPAQRMGEDGGDVTCFCASCGCFTTPDGRAPCPP